MRTEFGGLTDARSADPIERYAGSWRPTITRVFLALCLVAWLLL